MANHDIDHNLDAFNRGNTPRSDDGTVRHFEIDWAGFLPTISGNVKGHWAVKPNKHQTILKYLHNIELHNLHSS